MGLLFPSPSPAGGRGRTPLLDPCTPTRWGSLGLHLPQTSNPQVGREGQEGETRGLCPRTAAAPSRAIPSPSAPRKRRLRAADGHGRTDGRTDPRTDGPTDGGLPADPASRSRGSPEASSETEAGPKPGIMSARSLFRALVSAKWVATSLKECQPLKLLDASWYLPKMKRDPRQEFEAHHIPGAAFFDIDLCSDRTSPYDHMMPSAADFAEYVGKLGVGNGTHVVVYDASDQGLFSAPRVWWMFRAFGHETVSLLDGGLRTWKKEGYPLSSGKARPIQTEFRATLNPQFVKTYEEIKENIESRKFQVVDARIEGRFKGIEPEPREGIEPGHIPGTLNIPFPDFLTEEGLEKKPDIIQRLFQEKKVDLSKPLVATCGSGVTACHVALGAYLCGKPDVAIYDGAWVEWYMRARPEDVISEGRGKTL